MSSSFAGHINSLHGNLFHKQRVIRLSEAIKALIPKGTGLDIGTGDGKIASLLTQSDSKLKIFGLELPKRHQTAGNVILYDGTLIPFKTKSVDFVMLIDVLHHVDTPLNLLKECLRVTRQKIIIKDHLCENTFDFYRLKLMDWVGNTEKGISLPYNYLNLNSWTGLFRTAGIKDYKFSQVEIYKGITGLVTGGHLQIIFELFT